MKTTWHTMRRLIDETGQPYSQRSDADDVSYRIGITYDGAHYECSVLKSPSDNEDLLDFETNYLAGAVAVG